MADGLTASLGAFCADFPSAPPEAVAVARTGIADAVGVMLAAGAEPVVRAALAVHDAPPAAGDAGASVLLGPQRLRAVDAAMVNATAAHAFAMDDVAWGCHPSAVLMPTVLAEGEALGASGADAARAYVVGYEVLAELASREPDSLHATGWHPTAMLGPVAAAAAAAHLRRLDADRAAHALGIAASMVGGLMANFGTPTKALHAGRVASAGVLAARLAAEGVTASPDVLERPRGLLETISPGGRVDRGGRYDRGPSGLRIVDSGLSIKRHPVCYSTHRVVDAAIGLSERPGLDPARIARIEVTIGAAQAAMARHHAPTTPLEARYSVEFAAASGLLAGAAGFAQLREDFIRGAPLRRLLALTTLRLREDRSDDDPVFCPADRVVVRMDDGSVFDSGDVPHARGHARHPLDESQRREKFLDCVRGGGRDDGEALWERLQRLEQVDDLRTLAGGDGDRTR